MKLTKIKITISICSLYLNVCSEVHETLRYKIVIKLIFPFFLRVLNIFIDRIQILNNVFNMVIATRRYSAFSFLCREINSILFN